MTGVPEIAEAVGTHSPLSREASLLDTLQSQSLAFVLPTGQTMITPPLPDPFRNRILLGRFPFLSGSSRSLMAEGPIKLAFVPPTHTITRQSCFALINMF